MDDGDSSDEEFLPQRLCMLTDRGLRSAIEDQGYEQIYLNVPNGRYVQARATRGDWVYLLQVNACTGLIVDRPRSPEAQRVARLEARIGSLGLQSVCFPEALS
jgi:hypothetical protein